jgi:hypothetical protein
VPFVAFNPHAATGRNGPERRLFWSDGAGLFGSPNRGRDSDRVHFAATNNLAKKAEATLDATFSANREGKLRLHPKPEIDALGTGKSDSCCSSIRTNGISLRLLVVGIALILASGYLL